MPTQLFDPLRHLLTDLHAIASIGPAGKIELRFDGPVTQKERMTAQAVAWDYERLLRLQLEHGGASVQKLLAQGKISLEGGRYVMGG